MNTFPQQTRKRLVLTTMIVALSPTITYGQNTRSWNTTNSGDYETASNWFLPTVPTANNDVRFNPSGDYTVGFNTDHQATDVNVVFNARPTFSIAGDQSTDRTYDLSGNLTIEDEAQLTIESGTGAGRFHLDVSQSVIVDGLPDNLEAGVLTLRDSAAITSPVISVGLAAGTQGRVMITGADTEWNSAIFTAGFDGDAELTIEAGASVILNNIGGNLAAIADGTDSNSTVNVHGVGSDGLPSTWMVNGPVEIGDRGVAFFNVTGGARATHSSASLAHGSGSDATAHISGVDAAGNPSIWSTGNFTTSFFGGVSELTIDGGGQVLSDNVIHGGNGNSAVTIDGAAPNGSPSAWTITGELDMGFGASRDGEIFIRDGGHLSTTTTNMATAPIGARGIVVLSSTNPNERSTWSNSGDVYVGGDSDGPGSFGRLELHDNSRVDVGGMIKIYDRGDVRVHDQSILIADRIDNSDDGDFDQTGGEVQFNRFDGDVVHIAGTIAPGIGGSAALLIGDFTQQENATLELEVGGLIGAHDAFSITGIADLDGSLELSLINGFTPSPTDTFEVLTASSLLGFFDNAFNSQRINTTDGRGSFVVNYGVGSPFGANQIVLSDFQASATIPGDHDGDGDVDGNDFLAWQRNDGTAGGLSNWQTNYGTQPSTSAAVTTVPEPAAAFLIAIAAVPIACRRTK